MIMGHFVVKAQFALLKIKQFMGFSSITIIGRLIYYLGFLELFKVSYWTMSLSASQCLSFITFEGSFYFHSGRHSCKSYADLVDLVTK